MGSEGVAALLVGLCVVAVVVGLAMAFSEPARTPTPMNVVGCASACVECTDGNVVGCFECARCARYLPR